MTVLTIYITEEKIMKDSIFEDWRKLEDQVSSEIGHDIQIDTEGSLADCFTEDVESYGSDSAIYKTKWLLIYHFQSVGNSVSRLLEDYPEIEIC